MLICHSYVGLPEGICNYRRQHAGFSRMQEEQEPTIRAGEWDAHCKHERHWVLNKGCSSEIWNPVEPTDAWWCRIFDVPTDQLLVFWGKVSTDFCVYFCRWGLNDNQIHQIRYKHLYTISHETQLYSSMRMMSLYYCYSSEMRLNYDAFISSASSLKWAWTDFLCLNADRVQVYSSIWRERGFPHAFSHSGI